MSIARNGAWGRGTIGAGIVLTLALGSQAWADDDDDEWKVRWEDGLRVESADERFQLAFGGGLQADWTFVDQDEPNETFYGSVGDGNEFRRARLFVSGTLYERVRFKAEYDFVDGRSDIKDMYIEFAGTPVGDVRVGHFREPFGLEGQTEGRYTAFLERSLTDLFSPDRNTGAMLHGHRGERFTWAFGLFRETDEDGDADTSGTEDASRGKLNATLRLTRLIWYADDGKRLAHLGVSATRKDLGTDRFRFRALPEAHQYERYFVDTGRFRADETQIFGVEAAGVAGRFWAAAELMTARPTNVDFAETDPAFDGGYVQVGVFLTRDHRSYDTSAAAFGRTRPNRNFGEGGAGAWEVALRYSKLDLTDSSPNTTRGGKLDDLTAGINWYPNPASRVMLNYIRSEPDLPDFQAGRANFITLRFQVDF